MEEQTYARYALPGVLVALVIGVLVVLVLSGGSDGSKRDAARPTLTSTVPKPAHESITVRTGDNPSTLAQRAGIPVDRLVELNPRIDPAALQVGDRLKLVP